MDTPSPSTPLPMPILPLGNILAAVSDLTRWRIFLELHKGEPLPVKELARRLGLPPTNVSKHVTLLRNLNILQRGYGNLYRIPTHFLVPGQPILDFGAVLLRLDRLGM